ncbi:MAG: SurA N-terminal domain-containing protein [Terriglobia bacterium]
MFKSLRPNRKTTALLGTALLGVIIVWTGCSRKASSNGEIWAEVDGTPIYRTQVETYYKNRMAALPDPSKAEQALSFKLNILNELIDDQILVEHAAHAHVTVSEAEVDTRIAGLRSPYSKEEFEKRLKDQGLTDATLRQEIRKTLTIEKLINKEIISRIAVSGDEITAYYNHNKANFKVPETEYHLAQILVTPVPDPQIRNLMNDDAKNEVEAQRKVRALYAQIKQGADFSKLAQEYSEDPRTAPGGGDMGFVPASALASNHQLGQSIASLKPGEIGGIIHDARGYHIIKLLGREEAGQRELSDPKVQGAIRQSLTNEKEEALKAAYIGVLRDRAKIENFLAQKIVETAGSDAATD